MFKKLKQEYNMLFEEEKKNYTEIKQFINNTIQSYENNISRVKTNPKPRKL